MEEQKLQKRKKKAVQDKNVQAIATVCGELGHLFNRQGNYASALQEYKAQASAYKELGLRLENAKAHRMVGEVYMLLAEFSKALKHEEIHLNVARELSSKLEEQRALATIGRTHLLHGQSIVDQTTASVPLKLAEKAFMRSLLLCESLKGKVPNFELMDMRARLLLNLGVVLEHLGIYDRSLEFMEKAIAICKSQQLYELLHQCYMTEGLLFFQRHGDFGKALGYFNKACEVANRLTDKVPHMCETLWWKAEVFIRQNDLQSAKQVLIKAWKLKSPDKNEQDNIERHLKIVAAMCYTEESLITTKETDYLNKKKLFERMGDGSCLIKNYSKAIVYYLKMLEYAEMGGETGKDLIPIYVSLYQTYKDNKQYDMSLKYFWMEYELCKDSPKEAFNTLVNITDVQRLAGKEYQDIEDVFMKAKTEAKKTGNPSLEILCIKKLINLQRFHKMNTSADLLVKQLSLMGAEYDSDSDTESESEFQAGNTPNIGDDICIEDLSDISDTEESEELDRPRTSRSRSNVLAVKKNTKGETQLHQACISGNTTLVRKLLHQNHPVNIRDHAGWLPLHEACICGYREIVELLLDNGAAINDRGGTKCDGITPLYDAASNGHLEVIQLLLDRGASPTVLTDEGDSALHILRKWRASVQLEATEQLFYDTIQSKLHEALHKAGIIDNNGESSSQKENNVLGKRLRSKSKNNFNEFNKTKKSKPVLNKNVIGNLRNTIDDLSDIENNDTQLNRMLYNSSDNEDVATQFTTINSVINLENNRYEADNFLSDDSYPSETQIEKNARFEYQNVMKSLRNRVPEPVVHDNIDKTKKRSALMNSNEVGDDWLENDMEPGRSVKRRKCAIPTSKKSAPVMDIMDVTDVPRYNNLVFASDTYDSESMDSIFGENILDKSVEIVGFENLLDTDSNTRKSTSQSSTRKRQASLLDAGFSRERSESPSNVFCKLNLKQGSKQSQKNKTKSKRSMEADSTTGRTSPLDFPCSSSASYTVTQPVPQAALPIPVKVRVEDRLLVVPVSVDAVDSLSIGWLAKEAARRYYNYEGLDPSLNLLTPDGALLSADDPLSLVLTMPELLTNVTSWNQPPLHERYIEACSHLKTNVDNYIYSRLDICQATQALNLSELCMSSGQLQSLFRSLIHQSYLQVLCISDCVLLDSGIKMLCQSLHTLKNLKVLDVSANNLTHESLTQLAELIPSKNCMQNLEELHFGFNPIGNEGWKYLGIILQNTHIKKLYLQSCNLTTCEDCISLKMEYIEVLDLSYNDLDRGTFVKVISCLDANVIKSINFENVAKDWTDISRNLHDFFNSGSLENLVELNLSRCNMSDSDIGNIMRFLSKTNKLENLIIRYNNNLTSISLRRILFHQPRIKQIRLEGCKNILQFLTSSKHAPGVCDSYPESIKLSINTNSDDETLKCDILLELWRDIWGEKAVIDKDKQTLGVMHLTKS